MHVPGRVGNFADDASDIALECCGEFAARIGALRTGAGFRFAEVGELPVRGRRDPVLAYELLSAGTDHVAAEGRTV